jgi:hypothetical protein
MNKYFRAEPADHEILSDPKRFIKDKGSFFFFATVRGEIAGTIALIKTDNGRDELSKMPVGEGFRGIIQEI